MSSTAITDTNPQNPASMLQPTVGIIGIGNMGFGMLTRLRALGVDVVVHDIDPARMAAAERLGAQLADSAAQVARRADPVLVVVVDAAQTRDVLFGANGAACALTAGQTVMLCPTLGPADVQACAATLATLGVAMIDAPMSGGPARAAAGTMSLMVASEPQVLDRHRVLLQQLAQSCFEISHRIGDAAKTKLVNNLLAATHLAASAEAIALAETLGLDPSVTLSVIAQSSGQSWIGSDRMSRALANDYAPRAHTTLLAKDSGLAMQAAREHGCEPRLGALAAEQFQRALVAGYADLDDASLLLLTRQDLRSGGCAADDP